MKVFLSWSGEKSHKVAVVFRDWFPSVIQSLEPYVSSEDIDKGTRWSTDIAKELEDSTFGILCVTKENLNAPWLTFEAGALSKTMDKSFVSPFLFDIKRSEVDGPILQFQSTIFDKDDVYKLTKTLNKACGEDQLTGDRLEKAFTVWWPTLEEELNKLKDYQETITDESGNTHSIGNNDILEEILDLTRLNQKLLRNPENALSKQIAAVNDHLQMLMSRMKEERYLNNKKRKRFHPRMIEELFDVSSRFKNKYIAFQIAISFFREDFPWLYEAGMEVIATLKSNKTIKLKDEVVNDFMEMVEFSFEHPVMREMVMPDKEQYMMIRELPYMLKRSLNKI
ncbi:MAG: toll/interleukin-1 receptor domain-containing protein [Desulfobacula sp.]|uniref:TIR domain-containing protein n=1 Tax=Desulfobacula sp. TaxID=2593537 RepID=UPI0025BA18EB|nr:TIR domain-containing protein [Desulfobacula sp.]MCD4722206.1 toll/interleukin-1 receptor domain-containing protein [Desulfobacula sp.]